MTWTLDVSKLREAAGFGISLGHREMDGISAENFARDLLKAVAEIETLREIVDSARRDLGRLWPLVTALADDESHGNLTGRTEDAWSVYQDAIHGRTPANQPAP